MRQVNSTDFKNHLGEFLDLVRDGPITVNRLGKPAAILISTEQFSYFQRVSDAFQVARAAVAKTPGEWIGMEEALTELLKRLAATT